MAENQRPLTRRQTIRLSVLAILVATAAYTIATVLPPILGRTLSVATIVVPPLLQLYLFYGRGVQPQSTHPLKQFGTHDYHQGLLFIAAWAALAALVLSIQALRLSIGVTVPEISHVPVIVSVQAVFMALMHPIYISLTAKRDLRTKLSSGPRGRPPKRDNGRPTDGGLPFNFCHGGTRSRHPSSHGPRTRAAGLSAAASQSPRVGTWMAGTRPAMTTRLIC